MSQSSQSISLQAPDKRRCSLVTELNRLPWARPEHSATTSKCGIFFREQYELTGKLYDIARAVYYGRYVVAHKDDITPKLQLIVSLNKRFTHDHDETFLHESMSLVEDVRMSGSISELRSRAGGMNVLQCLSQTRKLHYSYTGTSERTTDLSTRVFADYKHHREMPYEVLLRRAQDNNPGVDVNSPAAKRADRLWLWSQQHKVEDEEGFQSGLGYLMEAEKLVNIYCPSFYHIYQSIIDLLRESYLSTLRLERLDKAIAYTKKATEATSASPTQRAIFFSDLGLHCQLRYDREHRLQDLEIASPAHREAVRLYPKRDSKKAILLDQLSNVLHSYYVCIVCIRKSAKHAPAIEYLEEAVLYGQQSVEIERSSYNLINLSNKFDQLSNATGDINEEYINKAADLACEAAGSKDLPSYEQGMVLTSMGRILARKFYKSPLYTLEGVRHISDIELALQCLLKCAQSPVVQPLEKIKAAREAGVILYDLHRYQEAWDCLREAVGHIPSVAGVYYSPEEQQHLIFQLSGLGSEACSAGLAAGTHPLQALYVLEQAREILTTNLHGGSVELDDLKCKAPDLYKEFRKLQQQVMQPSEQYVKLVDPLDLSQKAWTDPRERAIRDLDGVVKLVRESVPGLRKFLTILEPRQITELSDEDYIVVLNTSIFLTDAIVMKNGLVDVIRLSALEPISVGGRRSQLVDHFFKSPLKIIHNSSIHAHVRNDKLTWMLKMIWRFIVEPICNGLGLNEHISTRNCPFTPRVLWIPTGIFAQVPLHAAGDYSNGNLEDSATTRITSSYIASFRMLQHVRSRSHSIQTVGNKGVVVSMTSKSWASLPTGIRKYFLPSTDTEAASVMNAAQFIEWAQMPRAVKAQLLDILPSCNYLHVNSHAETNVEDPSLSHLVLLDEAATESEPIIARLSVKEMSSTVADKSILAFLAACSTAYGSVPELLDEGLQIGNAFQLAGFPHVIASLWPVYNFICPVIARDFYAFLNDHTVKHGGIGNDVIAWALHHAISELKNEYLDEPLIWAPFIHLGPMSKEVDSFEKAISRLSF